VFGVREDLVMSYKDMPAGTFPEGYALSGQVAEAFLQVDFDLTLVRE
jgi:hydroxyquinol 1,2-dioxygenase